MKHKVPVALAACLTLSLAMLALGQGGGAGSPDPGSPRQPGAQGDTFFHKEEQPKPENTRSLEGSVLNQANEPVEGAVVQLKDTKTLRVRSYITLSDGKYSFHGLSTETDYEVKATHEKLSSRTRRLTVYDSRKKANMDLKLEPAS